MAHRLGPRLRAAGLRLTCAGRPRQTPRRMRLLLLIAVLGAASPAGASTFLFLDSHAGDPVGGGERALYGSEAGAFQVSRNGAGVSFYFACTGEACNFGLWSFAFIAPAGRPLEPGVYDDAEGLQRY